MRELEVEVRKLDLVANERLAHHQALRSSITQAQTALELARQESHRGELMLVTCEKDLRATSTRLEAIEARLAVIARESEELSAALAAAATEKQAAEAILHLAHEAKSGAESQVAEATSSREACAAKVAEHRDATTESKVRLASARERLTSARGTTIRLEKSVAELVERSKRIARGAVAG